MKRLSFALAALMLFPAAPAWPGESEGPWTSTA